MPALTIARGDLFQERTRLLISVGGVAFSVILILAGLYRGWQLRVTAYLLFPAAAAARRRSTSSLRST